MNTLPVIQAAVAQLAPGLPMGCFYREERGDWALKLRTLKAVFLPLLIVFLVLGAIFGGFATPTVGIRLYGPAFPRKPRRFSPPWFWRFVQKQQAPRHRFRTWAMP